MSVYRTSHRDPRLEDDLHELLASGSSLETAILALWVRGKWGMLTLATSVAAVCNLDKREATRAVVKATFDHPRNLPVTTA